MGTPEEHEREALRGEVGDLRTAVGSLTDAVGNLTKLITSGAQQVAAPVTPPLADHAHEPG